MFIDLTYGGNRKHPSAYQFLVARSGGVPATRFKREVRKYHLGHMLLLEGGEPRDESEVVMVNTDCL